MLQRRRGILAQYGWEGEQKWHRVCSSRDAEVAPRVWASCSIGMYDISCCSAATVPYFAPASSQTSSETKTLGAVRPGTPPGLGRPPPTAPRSGQSRPTRLVRGGVIPRGCL